MPLAGPRRAFAEMSVQTASPARLITMLYDRLVRDIHDAESALQRTDKQAAHVALLHAQDIVVALRRSLDTKVWPMGENLEQLYTYLLEQLVLANTRKDPAPLAACRDVVEPLREAWHEAYRATGDLGNMES